MSKVDLPEFVVAELKRLQDDNARMRATLEEHGTAASLKACREVLEQRIMDDSRARGRAMAAREALAAWMAEDETRWVPEEVTDLLEVLR